MARLIDVAKAAGVSRSTVSNVFNNPDLVRPKVRERVEAAARALEYVGPDPKGRILRAGRFNAIAVLPPGELGAAEALSNPVFALFLKILYLGKGRTYGEHFLFALHTNAFAFFMLSLLILVPEGWGIVSFALMAWLTFYLPTAMRRVYGGTRTMTAVRWIVLMTLHFISLSVAVVAAVSQAFLH